MPDELSTEEAFEAIDQLADLKLKWLTLSGGEPLTRRDWPQLAQRLVQRGIETNMISNGWMIDSETVQQMRRAQLSNVAISVDGPPEIHDHIRKPGSYEHLKKAFSLLQAGGLSSCAITTVSKLNIAHLPQLRDELIDMKVGSWQLQFALPMGNFAEHQDWLIEPEQIDDIIEFCYQESLRGQITIFPADCIGYYNKKEVMTKKRAFVAPDSGLWNGCSAGLRSFGLLHNGDVLGCTSIRNPEFIEGNIKKQSLRSIWEDDDKFAWRRKFTKDKLQGHCRTCKYSPMCLGGCANSRLTINGSVESENIYCSYNLGLKKSQTRVDAIDNALSLIHI